MVNIFVFTILLAPNTADAVEERNEDVEEVMETSGKIFEVYQSDFEDEDGELKFVDSFVWAVFWMYVCKKIQSTKYMLAVLVAI